MADSIITDTNTSAFNEASLKMTRLHLLQDKINLMRQNPMGKTKLQRYAFRCHFDCLTGLYQEISAKCKDQEKKEVKEKLLELRTSVRELESRAISRERKNKGQKEDKVYELSFLELMHKVEDGLFDTEECIRYFLDLHGFSTLNMESDEGDAYN